MWLLNADILAGYVARQWLLMAAVTGTSESGGIESLTFPTRDNGGKGVFS